MIKKTLNIIGVHLQKVNLAKLIDDLEREQELADIEIMEEEERRAICAEAVAACRQTILEHMRSFLEEWPDASYEEWIVQLHPDNADTHKQRRTKAEPIDHRFYVEESDHRLIWNENMTILSRGSANQESFLSRKVKSKYKHGAP